MKSNLKQFATNYLGSALVAYISFWAGTITTGLNLLWLLVKDSLLMSWNIPMIIGVIFVVSVLYFLYQILYYGTDSYD